MKTLLQLVNEIEMNVWAFLCICGGVILVLAKHSQEGSLMIGGGLAVMQKKAGGPNAGV